jgi:hypothetical protein
MGFVNAWMQAHVNEMAVFAYGFCACEVLHILRPR